MQVQTTAQTQSERYVLGHSEPELQRLARQGGIFRELSLDLLRRAGIRPGMRVLDVGCGAGDVSLLIAELVGPTGEVVGIDRSPEAIDWAQRRTRAAGIEHASFDVAELDDYMNEKPFDALTGRLVLLYLPKPSDTIRALMRSLRPGALVVFQEMVLSDARSMPVAPIYQRCIGWIGELFERVGFPRDMGFQLFDVLAQAGLPHPSMTAGAIVDAGPEAACHPYLTETLRTIQPLLEAFQIATAAEVEIDTLKRAYALKLIAASSFVSQLMVGAWSRLPG